MKLIIVSETDFTPALHLDPHKMTMEFKGVSRPENVGLFYQQVIDWMDELEIKIREKKSGTVHAIFKLTYCNSASMKYILIILERLIDYRNLGCELIVDWYHDEGDDQMLEDGEDIADAAGIDFNFYPM